jgi:hypothetical protein
MLVCVGTYWEDRLATTEHAGTLPESSLDVFPVLLVMRSITEHYITVEYGYMSRLIVMTLTQIHNIPSVAVNSNHITVCR